MKKRMNLDNKGFSLVELIIVIAIMAILVGILAPNLLRYIERTNISSDTQTASNIRQVVLTTIMDPAIRNHASFDDFVASFAASGNAIDLNDAPDVIGSILRESLVGDVAIPIDGAWMSQQLRARNTVGISLMIANDATSVIVHVVGVTDTAGNDIVIGN